MRKSAFSVSSAFPFYYIKKEPLERYWLGKYSYICHQTLKGKLL